MAPQVLQLHIGGAHLHAHLHTQGVEPDPTPARLAPTGSRGAPRYALLFAFSLSIIPAPGTAQPQLPQYFVPEHVSEELRQRQPLCDRHVLNILE